LGLTLEAESITAQAAAPGIARVRLREATATDHATVDDAFAAFDLATRAGYQAFLEAQLSVLWRLEEALTTAGAERLFAEWPNRRRAPAIVADLADLGVGDISMPELDVTPAVCSDAAVLGTLYVLEGSRFGGALLARNLPPDLPRRFLTSAPGSSAWRSLLTLLDRDLASEPALDAAIAAAHAVFTAYEAAARARVETAGD
jgi:heme oxygenase (biliverdin-IX-beta and delta-forming)